MLNTLILNSMLNTLILKSMLNTLIFFPVHTIKLKEIYMYFHSHAVVRVGLARCSGIALPI